MKTLYLYCVPKPGELGVSHGRFEKWEDDVPHEDVVKYYAAESNIPAGTQVQLQEWVTETVIPPRCRKPRSVTREIVLWEGVL